MIEYSFNIDLFDLAVLIFGGLLSFIVKQHFKENEKESNDRISSQKDLVESQIRLKDDLTELKRQISVINTERASEEKVQKLFIQQSDSKNENEVNLLKAELDGLKHSITTSFKQVFETLEQLKNEKNERHT